MATNADTTRSLKSLKTARSKIADELTEAKCAVAAAQRTAASLANRLRDADAEISVFTAKAEMNASKRGDVVVTEHAMLRYCERVLRIDMQAIKDAIACSAVKGMAKVLGSGKFPVADKGFAVKVNKGVAVTVEVPDGESNNRECPSLCRTCKMPSDLCHCI